MVLRLSKTCMTISMSISERNCRAEDSFFKINQCPFGCLQMVRLTNTLIPHALANSIEKKEKSGPVLFFELGPTSNRDGGDY